MSQQAKKKLSTGKIVLIVILCLILLLAGVAAYMLTHYVGLLGELRDEEKGASVTTSANGENNGEEQVIAPTNIADDVFTFLLIGVDSRQDTYTGRSDSQMLISINQKQKKLVICSILRDCYVSIPGHGHNRINAAYAEGGTSLLTQTIKNNFGIPVNRVAVVNFKVVADFIDAIGGVDLNVSQAEIEQINRNLQEQNRIFGQNIYRDQLSTSKAGDVHLNGNQALAYARIRAVGTDFERTKRQRVVMEDAIDKVEAMTLSQQSALLKRFLPRVHTDLTTSEVIDLGSLVLRMKSYEV
ncbi:MAG: LCP family protein, partial [Clostridia bacterium]|nr:LCP family protein [Clostridia bacterium]